MRLKKEIVIPDFLERVSRCKADVYFRTDSGDNLDLKSQLAKFIFLAYIDMSEKEKRWLDGSVICQIEDDRELLKEFLTD